MWLLVLLCSCCLHQIASAIPSFAAECLREHNQIRARHGAPPLQWDSTLARHAQQWADKLNKMDAGSIHDKRTREGENIADGPNMSCKQGVADW
ncbi:Ectin [Exaiptasia diaphana]|nr:Ectin [Exaiptasia diaphana]